jgi:predicted ATP-grasp superfamily ATP-dependent carboligase
MTRILITDGQQRSTLAAVRSLGRRGVDIIVGEEVFPCLAGQSKYCHGHFRYPSPLTEPHRFSGELLAYLRDHSVDLLLPMTDVTCHLVAEHLDELQAVTQVPLVDRTGFNRATDKGELVRLCLDLEIPVPRTWFFDHPEHIDPSVIDCDYPVVVKPRRSRLLTSEGWMGESVTYAHSFDDLIARMRACAGRSPLPLVQERIIGDGCGAFLLFNRGRERAVFFHRRLREKPPSGGVSVLRESMAIDPRLQEFAVRLLRALNWHGVAMVEFKMDRRDGLPKVMEINPRFWGSLQLAIDAGADFPALLHEMIVKGDIAPMGDYRVGVRSRWLLGDLDHLLLRLLRSRQSLNLPPGAPGRLGVVSSFLNFFDPRTRLEIERWEDFRPAWFEWRRYLRG